MINPFEILKERIDFESVAKDHGREFNSSRKALCPFHDEKTPSFSLHPSRQYAHCFGCDKTADVIELEFILGKHSNRREAAKALNSRYNLGLKFNDLPIEQERELIDSNKLIKWYCEQNNKTLLMNAEAINWLEERKGITKDQVKAFKIGYHDKGWLKNKVKDRSREISLKLGLIKENNENYYDVFKNRITFPVWNRGRIKSIWAREYPDKADSNYKWIGLQKSEYIQNKPIAFVEYLNCEICFVTESIPDALAFQRIMYPAIALLGKDISTHNKPYFQKSKSILYFALDPDKSGKAAAYKLAKEFKGYVIDLESEKDPDELLAELGVDEFKKLVESSIEVAKFYLDLVIAKEPIENALIEISQLEYQTEIDRWLDKMKKKHGCSIKSLRDDLKNIEKKRMLDLIKKSEDQGHMQYVCVGDCVM